MFFNRWTSLTNSLLFLIINWKRWNGFYDIFFFGICRVIGTCNTVENRWYEFNPIAFFYNFDYMTKYFIFVFNGSVKRRIYICLYCIQTLSLVGWICTKTLFLPCSQIWKNSCAQDDSFLLCGFIYVSDNQILLYRLRFKLFMYENIAFLMAHKDEIVLFNN